VIPYGKRHPVVLRWISIKNLSLLYMATYAWCIPVLCRLTNSLCVFFTVNRYRERVALQCVKEDEVDDSQTGVYDNVDNVQQQLTRQRRRSRRDQYLNHVDIVDAGASVICDGESADQTDRTLNCSTRRRGRCADRTVSNRVVGPSFVSSARVHLGGSVEIQHQQHVQPQRQQHHSEQSPSSSDVLASTNSTPNCNHTSTSTAVSDNDADTVDQSSESTPDLPWNGYDNIVELKEAIFSSAAAKLAAGTKPKRGPATSTTTTTVSSSAADEGLLSDNVPASSGRAIGERVVDVHRQRFSAAGRELMTAVNDVETPSSEILAESSMSTATISTDTAPAQDLQSNSDTVEGPDTASTENCLTNGTLQQNGKSVSFETASVNSAETETAAHKIQKHKAKSKPPIGKAAGHEPCKKAEKKSERRREKEHKSAAASKAVPEQPDHEDGKMQQPTSKMSFLKSLLTRSRSPSPKRGSNSNNSRSESPSHLGRDVARRLSDPLKSSFKQTPDAPVVKVVVVKSKEKKKKQLSVDERNCSQRISDSAVNSNCKQVSTVNSSGEHLAETLATASTEDEKTSLTLTPDHRSETSQSTKTGSATNSVNQQEVNASSSASVSCQSTESAVVMTTASTLRTTETAGLVSSASGMKEQSSERRRSATIITLRSAASGGSSSTTDRLPADRIATTLPSDELHNPWLVNLKEFRLQPKLDSFEGEKVFKKDTATTRLVLPGFSRSRRGFVPPCNGELRPETPQKLTTTRKPLSERRDRHSAVTSPVYDAVYDDDSLSVYRSTTELTGNRCEPSITQRADDMGKSCSLQDLKQRTRTRQTSTVPDGTTTSVKIRTAATLEHAIDDDELRNCTGHVARDRRIYGSLPTTTSKPVKTVTFRDDVDANSSSAERRLDSVLGLGKTGTAEERETSRDLSASQCDAVQPPSVSGTQVPVTDDDDTCVNMTKNSSLPVCGQPTAHSIPVDLRDSVSALRDTITSCDLEELPKYLADMYKQHKLERHREQELAARDRKRLENIQKMWKEFENQFVISDNVDSPATNTANTEPTQDHVIGHHNAQTVQAKSQPQVYVCFLLLVVIRCMDIARNR